MQFLTDFADQAVVLPLGLIVGVLLAAFGWPRAALAWAIALGAALGLTLLAKLALLPCAPRVFGTALRTPSGHTAAASVTYGGLVALLIPGRWRLLGAVAASAAVGGVIAGTRLALGVHTGSEVVAGAAIGVAAAALLAVLAGERPGGPFSRKAAGGPGPGDGPVGDGPARAAFAGRGGDPALGFRVAADRCLRPTTCVSAAPWRDGSCCVGRSGVDHVTGAKGACIAVLDRALHG